MKKNVVKGTKSDEEEMLGDVTNISDDYANTAAEQELTEEEFEIIDEQVGNSTPEDSFVGKYVTEIQNRLKGGVTPIEYQRKTYWVNVEYEGFDYNTRVNPDIFYRPRVFIWLPDILNGGGANGLEKKNI